MDHTRTSIAPVESEPCISARGLIDAAVTIVSLGIPKLLRASGMSPKFLFAALALNEFIGVLRVLSISDAL